MSARATGAASPRQVKKEIFQTLVELGEFKTLTTALEAVGLDRKLKSSRAVTLFAPTDRAFSRLAAGTLDGLLKPASHDRLLSVLLYHLAPGLQTSAQLQRRTSLKTVMGGWAKLTVESEGLKIDGALVTRRDLGCGNGLIHVIDDVMLPNS